MTISTTTPRATPVTHLRLVSQEAPQEAGRTPSGDGTPLVGYLVLLPQDVDPAVLFADTGLRPQIHPVTADPTPAGPVATVPAPHDPARHDPAPDDPVPTGQVAPDPVPTGPAAAAPVGGVRAGGTFRGDHSVRIDTERHVAELDGIELDLTYLEFALLARLVGHPHRVHTREQLVEHVWGHTHVGEGRTVDVHVARLRRKLGAAHRHRIVTVRRVGYKYVPSL